MKVLHLTPVSSLPPITPEDHNFALRIKKEYNKKKYNLSFNELCWLIRDVRDTLQEGFSELKEDSRLRDTYEKLFASDVEIKGISINTNKGDIKISSTESLFNYFLIQIKKIHSEFDKTLNSEDDFLNRMGKQSAFLKTVVYCDETSLGPFQKKVVIGMFLVHFRLYKGKPLLTEPGFKTKQSEGELLGYPSYKHYLVEIVENRLKKYSSDLSI